MPKLFYYPKNASLVAHFVLEELEMDFELVLVDRNTNAHKSADYLSLNPMGRIPALVDGDLVLLESAAICLYLCERYSGSALLPRSDSSERPLFFQWLMYLTSTLQSEL
ncbi:MAG: glutathione S-transferase, partial [Gammaproteobacteria bacterium]